MYIIIVKHLSARLLMLQLSFSVDGSDSQITCSSSEIQTFITYRIRRHSRKLGSFKKNRCLSQIAAAASVCGA